MGIWVCNTCVARHASRHKASADLRGYKLCYLKANDPAADPLLTIAWLTAIDF